MIIEQLRYHKIQEFINYCKRYRAEQDISFLHDEDLEKLKIDDENPSYILIDNEDRIIGAVSLIIDEYYKRGKRGRFRIFHSINQEKEEYELMLKSILHHSKSLQSLFIHVPDKNKTLSDILESIGFTIERYSFELIRNDIDVCEAVFPQGFEIRTFKKGRDEAAWCEIRNAAFANIAGSSTPKTPEMIKMEEEDDHIEGGAMMLYHKKVPIGIIRVTKELDNNTTYAFISPVAIKPEYQGMGLSKSLLRTAIIYGRNIGMPEAMISVNAENERALGLYLKEGFHRNDMRICYQYNLRN